MHYRRAAALLTDAAGWLTGMLVAVASRYDFDPPRAARSGPTSAALPPPGRQPVIGDGRSLYRGRHQPGSFDEVRTIATTTFLTTVFITLADLLGPVRLVPASSPIVGGALALVV